MRIIRCKKKKNNTHTTWVGNKIYSNGNPAQEIFTRNILYDLKVAHWSL